MMLSTGTLAPTDVRLFVRDLRNQARHLGDVLAVLPDEPDDAQRAEFVEWANVYLDNAQRALDELRDVVAEMAAESETPVTRDDLPQHPFPRPGEDDDE